MTTRYVNKLLPLNSIIIYNKLYYEIDKIIGEYYVIRRVETEIVDTSKQIRHFDCEIQPLSIKQQQNIKKFNEFRMKYNKTVEYLNKYKNTDTSRYSLLSFIDILKIIDLKSGITINHLFKIMMYLKKTLDKKLQICCIFENPFNFIKEEKQLLSYSVAEKICNELNIHIPFEIKCEKWSYYHIIHMYKSFYVDVTKFYKDFDDLCKKNGKKREEYLNIINSVTIKKIIDHKEYITTQYLYDYEKNLTSEFIDLYSDKTINVDYDLIEDYIKEFEDYITNKESRPYFLDIEQKTAVKNTLTNTLSVITGFPGTGKSSIVQCILFVLSRINQDEYNNDVSIMSPTGLAYINIQKKCKYDDRFLFNEKISGTCHKTLYNIYPKILSKIERQQHNQYSDYFDDEDEECVYVPKTIIVDEFSMVDIFMFNELIEYCKIFNSQLIIVGDHNQLPSIEAGSILNSIIESNKEYELFNITNLTKIKRQDSGSLLMNIIKMTNKGLTIHDFIDESMQFINISAFLNEDHTINKEMFIEFIKSQNIDKDNGKILSYFNGENEKSKSHPTNVLWLNKILQEIFNPNGFKLTQGHFDTFTYKIGDLIIRTENVTTENEFRANGEQAVIQNFDKDNVYIKYLGSNDDVPIGLTRFYNEFKLAYALTIHKAQGSQYKNIIIFIEPNSYVFDKPALYTAISRAEERCFIISDYDEFLKIQKNIKSSKKPTLFLREIEQLYDLL
jgi:hypothetical protein